MDIEEIKNEIYILFHPEPDEDGFFPREIPHQRLKNYHDLDTSYIFDMGIDFEGSTIHPNTRICPAEEEHLHMLTRNNDVPTSLFYSGLKLFADSIIEYNEKDKRKGGLRYYPPIILTFWSAFETYIRHSSELMLLTVKDVPKTIRQFLTEQKEFCDKKGNLKIRNCYHSLLDRYVIFLRYGFNYHINRGNRNWQNLEQAKSLRDYYTHLDVQDPRSISTSQVLKFMESVLLGIIWPSTEIKRTLLLQIYFIYEILLELMELAEEFIEEPILKNMFLNERYMFYCPFNNVDIKRFPNTSEESHQRSNIDE